MRSRPDCTTNNYEAELLVSSFHGRPFNSPNDVVVHSDGSIWFTDPIYGWEQGIRPRPRLPNQVYRFDPATRGIRAMADGFGRPNGICFSPDEKIVYITDTDWIHGDGSTDEMRASHMYVLHSSFSFADCREIAPSAPQLTSSPVCCSHPVLTNHANTFCAAVDTHST